AFALITATVHTVKETSTQAIQFHSRAFQLAKSRPLRSSAKANTQCLRTRVLVASSKHYWWTAKPRSPHRAPSKTVIRCQPLSPLRSRGEKGVLRLAVRRQVEPSALGAIASVSLNWASMRASADRPAGFQWPRLHVRQELAAVIRSGRSEFVAAAGG